MKRGEKARMSRIRTDTHGLQFGKIMQTRIDLHPQIRTLNGREGPFLFRLALHSKEHRMSLNHLSERVSEAFIRATGRRDSAAAIEELSDVHARPFSIAISREAGTRGPLVARTIAERLAWKAYDHELLE